MGVRPGGQCGKPAETLTAAFHLAALLLGPADTTDPALARRLWRAGLEREGNLATDSALALYRAARAADPSYLAAQFDWFSLMVETGAVLDVRRELSRPDHRGGELTICMTEVTRLRRDDPEGARRLAFNAKGPSSNCSLTIAAPFLNLWSGVSGRTLQIQSDLLRGFPELIRGCPECWRLRHVYAMKLDAEGRRREALVSIDQAISAAPDGYSKILLYIYSLGLGVERRRALARTIAAAAARDPRPGVRLLLLHEDGKGEEAIGLARSLGDWFNEWQEARAEGHKKVESGEPLVGLAHLTRAVSLTDSIGRPPLQMISYMDRGRAYLKLGRLDAAERDLLHAIALGRGGEEPYYLRESHHNLAHVHESAGRFRDATRAIDEFARLSRDPGLDAWWLSLHDAGVIRWKAGWHAAARRDFESMVRAIDQRILESRGETSGYYYAAEYYERLGDLPRARAYYQAGAIAPGNVDPQNLAGLVRVFERLGQEDSAETVARSHDAKPERWPATESPLLPGVLANRGRYTEAVRLARAWTERQAAGGHVPATTAARLELADLLLRWGKPDSALHEATEAERLARSVTLTAELIRAGELRGRALIAMGRADSGLRTLRAVASLANAHPTVESTLRTQLPLGDALAAVGATDSALVAYDVAARAVERVTGRLDLDLERAGYRDRHPLPFDGALRILLRRANNPGNIELMLLWSQRRTGAALARATGMLGESRPATLREVRRGLGRADALVNYLLVDSLVAALVVTQRHTDLVPLPITTRQLRLLIDRLRRPLVTTSGGRIDLARAQYDDRAAQDLHAALLVPLESLLAGIRWLAIVPDGPLVYVPFEALVTGRLGPGTTRYLIDRFEIAYLPSAAFLGRRPTGSSSQHLDPKLSILAVENDVSAGEQEMAVIRAAWSTGGFTSLVGARATETAVRAAAHSHAILHLATHAVADGRDPLASHLKLRPDDGNDGFLHVNEIGAERLGARLVVLSGCETLVGPDYRGEGLMGLARAFLASGSAAVVASRWPVGPATAELMGGFYSRLANGEHLAGALRNAQLDLRRNPRTAHPFHWAGFVLVTGGRS